MPPNAARKMPARQHTQPFSVSPSSPAKPKRPYRPPAPAGRRESTKPFRSEPPEALKSDVREIAPRLSYRPPATVGPTSKPPKASVSLAAFKKDEPAVEKKPKPVLRAVPGPKPSAPPALPAKVEEEGRRDDTPSGKRQVAQIPSPPPVPREAVLAMPTAQLPLEEIDYDEAYSYDADALEARLKNKSIIPEPIVAVATDVRQSLTPAGRQEAKKELRDMRRVSISGFARLLRKAADLLDAYA